MPRFTYALLFSLLFPTFSSATPAKEPTKAVKATATKGKVKAKPGTAKPRNAKKPAANPAASAVPPHPVAPAAVAPATAPSPTQLAGSETWCAAIGKRLGSVPPPVCNKLGLQASSFVSGQGHALMARDVAPPTRKIAQAGKVPARARRILLIGGIHGDELTSASIVFRWLQWLDEADSEARQYHWRVIPVANPDGLLANPPQRVNSHGVDLNRNFPTPDWESDAQAYWAKKTGRDPRRFPGQKAMSEPETRWLHDEIDKFQPDVVVSVHAPYGILDYDGPAHQPRRFGHLDLNRLGIYPGSLGNYGGVHKNMPVITIELPNATSMPPAKEQREIWEDMLTWLRRNIASKTTS